ncbi:MAG: hypothetical protein LBN43_03985 [Oscillospiraceae bacterium]|jgi:hypothetical protein|nr:hypothetical protein [Oscillospiraceae bacterium]
MDNNNDNENNNGNKKGFMYWWVNVFMFHYFKYAVGGLTLVILILVLTLDATGKTKYDIAIAVVAGYGISEDELEPLLNLAADVVGDLDGDGAVNIDLFNINLNTTDAMNQFSRFELTVADEEFMLILLDNRRSVSIGERGDFDNLDKYDFAVEEDYPYRLYIGDSEIIADFPKVTDSGGTYEFTEVEYACLQTWKAKGSLGEKRADAAVRLLRAIADAKAE